MTGDATVHNVQTEDAHVLMAAWQDCREWLRFHGDYDVRISMWGSFGCHTVELTRLGHVVYSSFGARLGKRLAEILKEMNRICRNKACNVYELCNGKRSGA